MTALRVRIGLGLAGAVATLAVGGAAHAAACMELRPSVAVEYREAVEVAEVRVARIGPMIDGGPDDDDFREITLEVLHVYKGEPGGQVVIRDPNTSARLPWTGKEPQILFLRRDVDGSRFVDTCGNSTLVASAPADVVTRLKALSRKTR